MRGVATSSRTATPGHAEPTNPSRPNRPPETLKNITATRAPNRSAGRDVTTSGGRARHPKRPRAPRPPTAADRRSRTAPPRPRHPIPLDVLSGEHAAGRPRFESLHLAAQCGDGARYGVLWRARHHASRDAAHARAGWDDAR